MSRLTQSPAPIYSGSQLLRPQPLTLALALDMPTRGRGVEELVPLVRGWGIHVEVWRDEWMLPVEPPFFDNLRELESW